jgi:hypothetical protein
MTTPSFADPRDLLTQLQPVAEELLNRHRLLCNTLATYSLANAINTLKNEIERSKKNTLIANLIANLVV